MQQRVGLARALAVDPKVLLFDEPFSALDPLIRRDMQNEVIRLQDELGTTMVFITHDLSEALKLGDRILIMRDGEVVQIGPADEVVGAPADDYVARLRRATCRGRTCSRSMGDARRRAPTTPWRARRWTSTPSSRSAAQAALAPAHPVRVVENGKLVGIVDDEAILRVGGGRGAQAVGDDRRSRRSESETGATAGRRPAGQRPAPRR